VQPPQPRNFSHIAAAEMLSHIRWLCVVPGACAGVAKGGVAVFGGLVVFWILQKVSSCS
jgi:hypothetical protein